jgi:hypothetical protein
VAANEGLQVQLDAAELQAARAEREAGAAGLERERTLAKRAAELRDVEEQQTKLAAEQAALDPERHDLLLDGQEPVDDLLLQGWVAALTSGTEAEQLTSGTVREAELAEQLFGREVELAAAAEQLASSHKQAEGADGRAEELQKEQQRVAAGAAAVETATREAVAVLGQALDRQGVALEGLDQRLQAERAQPSVSVPAGGVLGVCGGESVRVASDVGSVESTTLPTASSVAVPVLAGPTPDVFGGGAAPALVSSATLDSASAVSVFAPGGAATLVAAATGAGGGTTRDRAAPAEIFCHRRPTASQSGPQEDGKVGASLDRYRPECRIRNWDVDGNRLMHTIDNIELVLSALNSMERKGATTTFMGGATIFHFPDTGLTHASKKGATTG